jgi:hypothetical protein
MTRIRRFMSIAALVLGGSLVAAASAAALPSVDLTNTVTGSQAVGPCTGGNQTYQVSATLTVHNTAEEDAVFATTDFDVKYNVGSGGQQTQSNVTVIDAGGFIPGQTVAPGATETYNVVVQVTLPCGITTADLIAKLTLQGRPNKEFSDASTFVSGGTEIPAAGVGGLGLAAVLGVGLLVMQVRRRRAAA